MKISSLSQNVNMASRFSLLRPKEQKPRKQYIEQNEKQVLPNNIHYVQLNFYPKKKLWAYQMNALTYDVSKMVHDKKSYDEVLSDIEEKVSLINPAKSKYAYGKRRTNSFREYPLNEMLRGMEYYRRYIKKLPDEGGFCPKANREYKNANVCSMESEYTYDQKDLLVNISFKFNEFKNIELARHEYDKLMSLENPTIQDINRACATIKWLFCQETPYERGTDSISSVLIKGIYHAYDVEMTPLRPKCSLDFEAFDTNLDDYIERFPTFFQQKPRKFKD